MTLLIKSFGCLAYEAASRLQMEIHAAVVSGTSPETVLWGEHPPCLTVGKNANGAAAIVDAQQLRSLGFELHPTDRGGEVTLHDRGQLVVYPILRIGERELGVRRYVELLEEVLIQTIAVWGVKGERSPEYPGVWVGTSKIAALGIRISQRVSRHGVSLNVCNSLKPYEFMIPCGIRDRGVTSLAACIRGDNAAGSEKPATPEVSEVAAKFLNIFESVF